MKVKRQKADHSQTDCEKQGDQSWLTVVKKHGSPWSTIAAVTHECKNKVVFTT